MSPSRGVTVDESTSAPTSPESQSLSATERTAQLRSSSALASLTQNIQYLISPSSPTSPKPVRLRTRALLRTLHSVAVFIFWRVIRYAKYAVVGSIVAALSATTIGSFATGIGWVVAPTGIVGVLGMSTLWWVGKWGFSKTKTGKRWGRKVEEADRLEREDRETRKEQVKTDGQWRDVTGPKAVPW
ncbi:predicted protein [Sclerotinia sclerotiorum 1980 UF-70]|uniref:Uncharacterized protein n=2 Tax=Sclerotinia sclerotiorum (strain ATCC 18683 / 1980 / Ss-1) TaxID=665079 RepID=A0A1D9Q7J8_SCLS1|nr:predicted protein [Sclerotinia sclerotiorum 1980 UF-70]APA10905.1 hypothetical protein sscle_07g056750 [Sclerotinia sclerotiorum 1980 UF-70]EDO00942.1 predicted protein [Sclerotinia sclerotiorum 1980 UF-70]